MQNKPVYVQRAASYNSQECCAAVQALFDALPAAAAIRPGAKILIKPNLLARAAPQKAVCTHPEVVRAVIRACKARGAQSADITVADSPGGLYNPRIMHSVYQASGLAAVCAEEQVAAYDACETVKVAAPNGVVAREFELLRPVAQADVIIDLPKLKTHVMTGLTAGCKNMFGVIPGLAKAEWHTRFPDRERFGEMLIDLLQTVRPTFALLDGIVGMEGDGPSGGSPRPLGLLLASEDLPALDLACCALIGLEPQRVPYLAAAQRRGLCGAAFDPALLAGDTAAFVPPGNWALPSSFAGGGVGSTDFAKARSRIPAFLRPAVAWAEQWAAPHPAIQRARCIGCGKCAEICPRHTIRLHNGKAHILPKQCIRCFCCHEMCPVKAIEVKQLRIFRL